MVAKSCDIEFGGFFVIVVIQRLDSNNLNGGMLHRSLLVGSSIHIPYWNGVYQGSKREPVSLGECVIDNDSFCSTV